MAILKQEPTVYLNVTMQLSEAEARALAELAEWNPDDVLNNIKTAISSKYEKEHGAAFKSILISARNHLPPILKRLERARAAFITKADEPQP